MASARKKQDEKNLKVLRELVSLPGNKHCFDCNQRGPTYVNVTIGSFVCTKCSGMLRGLTPPHRVKSISMASFTAEEVDQVKSRGNDYCRQTWLALLDQNINGDAKDDQQTKDFMIDKYELKRFYHDKGLRNGTVSPPKAPEPAKIQIQIPSVPANKNGFSGFSNGNANLNNEAKNDFVADFNSANIFSTAQFNNNGAGANATQPSFANFDNNVIFNSANVTTPLAQNGSPSGLQSSPPMNKIQAPPSEDRYAALKDLDNALKSQQMHQEHHQQQQQHHHQQQQQQQQQQSEWSAAPSSNGSGYASPLYGSPSTTGSMYGSPSQGNFATAFQDLPASISNPFSVSNASPRSPWSNGFDHNNLSPNGNTNATVVANGCFANFNGAGGANPFRDSFGSAPKFNGTTNGFHGNGNGNGNHFQQSVFAAAPASSSHFGASKPWAQPNPFSLGVSPGTGSNSNNPFL